MGPEFFQTQMGRRYYESTMPRIAEALERIATALENANKIKGGAAGLVQHDGTPVKEGD